MAFNEYPAFESIDALLRSNFQADAIQQVTLHKENKENPASTTNSATITWLEASKPATKVFIKSCPAGGSVAAINDICHIFTKEAKFFSELAPKMRDFQTSHGIAPGAGLAGLIPSLVALGTVNKAFYICMENFLTDGFKVTGKEEFHTLDQVKCALAKLGEFHATSHAMGIKEKDYDFLEDYLTRQDAQIGNIFKYFFAKPLEDALGIIELVLKGKKTQNKHVDSISIPETVTVPLIRQLTSFCDPLHALFERVRRSDPGPFGVVVHGDFHMWNMAFHDNTVKFFDFQVVHWGSPASDINHYLCQITTSKMREQYLPEMLEAYLGAFRSFYRKLGRESPLEFTPENLMNEYVARSPLSFVFGFACVLVRFVTDQEAMKRASNGELSEEERLECLLKAGPRILDVVQIIIDNCAHYRALGTFDLMRNLIDEMK